MEARGTAVKQDVRSGVSQAGKAWRVAYLELRDETLGLCELIHWLNGDATSPFASVVPGQQVAYPIAKCEVYKNFVTLTVSPVALTA